MTARKKPTVPAPRKPRDPETHILSPREVRLACAEYVSRNRRDSAYTPDNKYWVSSMDVTVTITLSELK